MDTIVIGDVHYNNKKFTPMICDTLQYIKTSIANIESDKQIIFLGDILDRAMLTPDTVQYLTKYMQSLFTDAGVTEIYVIRGNHDYNSTYQMNTLQFLENTYYDNSERIHVINTPTCLTISGKQALLVPHTYSGYKLESKYDMVLAHLGLPGLQITDTYVYNKMDSILWEKENAPAYLIIGHIHTPVQKEQLLDTEVWCTGNITPITWGESNDKRFVLHIDSTGTIAPIPIQYTQVVTVDTIEKAHAYNTKNNVAVRLVTSEDVSAEDAMLVKDIVVTKERKHTQYEAVSTMDDAVTLFCKTMHVNKEELLPILKEVGFHD